MPDTISYVSKIITPSGDEYSIKDAEGRTLITERISIHEKGANNGVANINSYGKIPLRLIPTIVDVTYNTASDEIAVSILSL